VYAAAMFQWPRFATRLRAGGSPEQRVASLLADLAEPMHIPAVRDVLTALFDDDTLVGVVERLAPRVDHVGFVAPAKIGAGAIEELLRESPFREQLRAFRSAILVQELSCQLGRKVDVTIVQGRVAGRATRSPAVEIFIADLAPQEIERLIMEETGCHVALALESAGSLEPVRAVLHAHGCWENPLMRNGALVNQEIHSSVLYVNVPGHERTRRLEFIAFNGAACG